MYKPRPGNFFRRLFCPLGNTKYFSKKIMKYYQLTVTLKSRKMISAIRELEEDNIDLLYTVYEMKARKAYGAQLAEFNIGLVSKNCKPVQAYLQNRSGNGMNHAIDPAVKARR
jgi:hypothetical protein